MGRSPLISVITTSLNSARYIEECIASVRLQEYRNIEHIIVDGASTDGTVAIIKRFDDKYNMRWISEPDKSAVEAVNKGLRQAKGDIVSILPADSFYFPWTALSVVRGFRDSPQSEIVYGDIAVWNPMSRFGVLGFAPTEKGIGETLRFTCLPSPSVFFGRKVIDALGPFNEALTVVCDWDYLIRAWKSFRFHKLNEVLTGVRSNPSLETKGLRQQVKAKYFSNTTYVRELLFTARYSMHAAKENLALLANSLSGNGGATRWGRLIDCDGISRTRLFLTILSTWALYTRNGYEKDFSIGYLSARKLSEVCFGVHPPVRGTSQV